MSVPLSLAPVPEAPGSARASASSSQALPEFSE